MKETALYWVGKDGSPFTIKFPLLLDTEGYFGAIGPYFNLEKVSHHLAYIFSFFFFGVSQMGGEFDERSLSRAKAVFEFRPFPADEELFPKEASDCYHSAFELLSVLTTELETERNKGFFPPTFPPACYLN